jgi:hypothetical protein
LTSQNVTRPALSSQPSANYALSGLAVVQRSRQKAYRDRRQPPPAPVRRRATGVYECGECGERQLGRQRTGRSSTTRPAHRRRCFYVPSSHWSRSSRPCQSSAAPSRRRTLPSVVAAHGAGPRPCTPDTSRRNRARRSRRTSDAFSAASSVVASVPVPPARTAATLVTIEELTSSTTDAGHRPTAVGSTRRTR